MITLIMLISHTITDFIIQDKLIVMKKANMEMKGYISHGFGLLITSLPIQKGVFVQGKGSIPRFYGLGFNFLLLTGSISFSYGNSGPSGNLPDRSPVSPLWKEIVKMKK